MDEDNVKSGEVIFYIPKPELNYLTNEDLSWSDEATGNINHIGLAIMNTKVLT